MDVENQLIAWAQKEEQQWYSYDKLILATGASQFSTQIRGSQTEKLLKYKFLSGALAAVPLLEKSQTVAVIGAGPIGMEAIDFLVKMKKTVHVFESLENLLPKYFDKEMVAEVQKSHCHKKFPARLFQEQYHLLFLQFLGPFLQNGKLLLVFPKIFELLRPFLYQNI